VGVAVLTFFIILNSKMGSKIADDMRAIWKASLSNHLEEPMGRSWVYSLRTNTMYQGARSALQARILPAASALLLVYLLLTVTNHISFNFFDAAGFVCREASNPEALTRLTPGMKATVDFDTSQLCQSTKIALQRNGVYLIQFDSTASFRDGWIDGSKGFSSTDVPSWYERALFMMAVPLRREWVRPWFRVVARTGGSGGEETFLDPDFSDIHWIDERVRATRDGELFLFVNDAVIGVPGLFGIFYSNNSGTAKVTITRRS
jgi:hypothetical protein